MELREKVNDIRQKAKLEMKKEKKVHLPYIREDLVEENIDSISSKDISIKNDGMMSSLVDGNVDGEEMNWLVYFLNKSINSHI